MFQEPGFKMGLMPAEMRVSALFLCLDVRGIPPKTPVSPFLLSRKKRSKRKHDPPDLPFKGGSICYGQRPAYAKILVWLSSFRPFGIRHSFLHPRFRRPLERGSPEAERNCQQRAHLAQMRIIPLGAYLKVEGNSIIL